MKQQQHDEHPEPRLSRRTVLKGAASAAALGSTATLGTFSERALAQGNLRAQILQFPGVGKGAPTDADWQKVGELCLGPTKASVKEGEFKGVELSFMGLNNQNLHNLLFRGFLKLERAVGDLHDSLKALLGCYRRYRWQRLEGGDKGNAE